MNQERKEKLEAFNRHANEIYEILSEIIKEKRLEDHLDENLIINISTTKYELIILKIKIEEIIENA